MFDVLTVITASVAVRAVYDAALKLFERRWVDKSGEFDRLAAEISPGEAQPEHAAALSEQQVTRLLLAEIQRLEDKSLVDLSDAEVERYTAELVGILEERIRRQPRYSEEKGKALLSDLREKHTLGAT